MELTLPMNYVELEQEEMMYLDGGASYRGYNAWLQISHLVGTAFGWFRSAAVMAAKAGAYVATGWGTVISMFQALGASASVISAIWQSTMVLAASYYTMRDGGFQHDTVGFFVWKWSNVKPL